MRWTAGGEVWVQDLCKLLCCVLGQKHFALDHRASENCQGSLTKCCGGNLVMNLHPIQGTWD